MPRVRDTSVSIIIDKFTRSIENVLTGDSFNTDILEFAWPDPMYKNSNWRFDWKKEALQADRKVYKLVVREAEPPNKVIQGLISLKPNYDHVFVHLVESAKFNQGKTKVHAGVPGNLFAYACKVSMDLGYGGFVTFVPKTQLVEHYIQSLGAVRFLGGQLMLNESTARFLIEKYYNR